MKKEDMAKNKRMSPFVDSGMVANLVPDIIAEVNADKVYVWLNKAGTEFFGEKAIGKEVSYFFEGKQKTYKKVEPLFKGKEGIFYVESWQRRQDGEKRLLSWWCRNLKDKDGKVKGALSIARDITQEFRMEEKLHYSEAQLHNALQLAHLGPWEYDALEDVFTFNDSFYALYHTNADKAGGYRMSSADYARRFVHPEDMPIVGSEVEKALKDKSKEYSRQLVHRIACSDGGIRYINVRFFAVKDKKGRTIKTYGINQDITAQKAKEDHLEKIGKELQTKVEELEKINKLMVDRELKMMEMKNRIKILEDKLSKA